MTQIDEICLNGKSRPFLSKLSNLCSLARQRWNRLPSSGWNPILCWLFRREIRFQTEIAAMIAIVSVKSVYLYNSSALLSICGF